MRKIIDIFAHYAMRFWHVFDMTAREKAVDAIEVETAELENIFGLLVLGFFVGLPSPPMQITLDLLPAMERDLVLMIQKVDTASSALSELVSVLDIG